MNNQLFINMLKYNISSKLGGCQRRSSPCIAKILRVLK